MIKIVDNTLIGLEQYEPCKRQIEDVIGLLLAIGVDEIELSENIYRILGTQNTNPKYTLRTLSCMETKKYPAIRKFICKSNEDNHRVDIVLEFQINDIREFHTIKQFCGRQCIRVAGLDDVLLHDYGSFFKRILDGGNTMIELSAENDFHCATAIAMEWINAGGENIVASFNGVSGNTPLEEIILALRVEKRRKPNHSLEQLSALSKLFCEITGTNIPPYKAVVGQRLFHVESGIHVDGILKNAKLYEPFEPEIVGQKRKIVVGKHSGRGAIIIKLKELGLYSEQIDIPRILSETRKKSVQNMCALTDEDFIELVNSFT